MIRKRESKSKLYEFPLPRSGEVLTRDQAAAISARMHSHPRGSGGWISARNELIEANYALVIFHAKRCRRGGIEDAFMAGVEGLAIAAERWKPDGSEFSTYASIWIRQRIFREWQDTGLMIRVPAYLHSRNARDKKGGKHAEQVEAAFNAGYFDEDSQRGHCIGDVPDGRDHEIQLDERSEAYHEFARLAEILSDRERAMVAMLYGIDTGEPMTLKAIGEEFGCTREWVRQIVDRAIRKMRAASKHIDIKYRGAI